MLSRRRLLVALMIGSAAVGANQSVMAAPLPKVVISKDPSCGCCTAWAHHIQAAGFPVEVRETNEIEQLKSRLRVPRALASCHTAEVDGYTIEGHIPADAIKRLLIERPHAKGLAVPGMPIGSPGMEVQGLESDTYDVVLFGSAGQTHFARYRGLQLTKG